MIVKRVLILSTFHDLPTLAARSIANEVKARLRDQPLRSQGIEIHVSELNLWGLHPKLLNFQIGMAQPDLVVYIGHGEPDKLRAAWGSDLTFDEFVSQCPALFGKTVILNCCYAGSRLGPRISDYCQWYGYRGPVYVGLPGHGIEFTAVCDVWTRQILAWCRGRTGDLLVAETKQHYEDWQSQIYDIMDMLRLQMNKERLTWGGWAI